MESQFVIEESLKIITVLLYEASNHFGVVYGDYVKEIVNKLKNPLYKVNYDKIKIYFDREHHLKLFKSKLFDLYRLSIANDTIDTIDVIVHGVKITTLCLTKIAQEVEYDVDLLYYNGLHNNFFIIE